jgi:hemerythrin
MPLVDRPKTAEIFPWNPGFEVGEEKIDARHVRLVEIINNGADPDK